MLPLDDPRWPTLLGGRSVPYDPRGAFRQLEAGEVDAGWGDLWDGLHHQGNVNQASFASVPHLVRIQLQRGRLDWNPYALVATIELARDAPENPPMLEWLRPSYDAALEDLFALAIREFSRAASPTEAQALLSVLALSKGDRRRARILLVYTDDELDEMTEMYDDR